MAGAEVRICGYRTDSHFHKRHNVHEQHYVRFVDKCNKKRKRAWYKEQEHAEEIHSAGILPVEEEIPLALKYVLEVEQ